MVQGPQRKVLTDPLTGLLGSYNQKHTNWHRTEADINHRHGPLIAFIRSQMPITSWELYCRFFVLLVSDQGLPTGWLVRLEETEANQASMLTCSRHCVLIIEDAIFDWGSSSGSVSWSWSAIAALDQLAAMTTLQTTISCSSVFVNLAALSSSHHRWTIWFACLTHIIIIKVKGS